MQSIVPKGQFGVLAGLPFYLKMEWIQNQKGDLKVKVLFTSIVVMTALAGCSATMPNIADTTKTDTSVQKIEKIDPDIQAALADMKLVGFKQEDFGSEEAFNSAAKMVANLGAEWQTFNSWTEDLLDPNNQRKALERIRTANDERRQKERKVSFSKIDRYSDEADKAVKYGFHDCFYDSGELRSVDDFISHYALTNVASFKSTVEIYERCLINGGNECTENGQELSLDKFLVKHNEAAPQARKELAFNEYYEYCAVRTPVSSVQYTISFHDNDVMGSLIAAAASRVGWDGALKMSRDVLNMQSRSGAMNMIAANFYNYQRTGYFEAFDIRPFAIGRSSIISVMHVGGMCAAFGAGKSSQDSDIEIDELAIALGAKPRQADGGYHCLKWTDGNWKRVADYIAGESEGLRGFMSVYSPAFNNYQVPYWSYPGPYQHDSTIQTQLQKKGSGIASYTEKVTERETCSTYAAGHSGLATWSYPACDYLEKASESMKAKAKMMQTAGRFDAYICSRSEAVNGYGKPDLSRCPTVFSREQIEAGEHKR
ncbi:hypothetical protein AYI98_04850 [Shewanella algae]|uniref:hypothetical protein n=1 Tax=Shewanella algae TaxID=38313 RepID=UPI001183EB71|nr:hypothetical protein [Shewanella algae]TVL52128.1 hypothetical protein AYI98_04850 [Shewanella algae]